MEFTYNSISDFIDDTDFNNSHSSLSLCYFNARSLHNKFDDIQLTIRRLNFPNIIIISENWLWPGEEKFYELTSYQSYHVIRDFRGGGISIYISNKYYSELKNVVNDFYSILHIILKGNIVVVDWY